MLYSDCSLFSTEMFDQLIRSDDSPIISFPSTEDNFLNSSIFEVNSELQKDSLNVTIEDC